MSLNTIALIASIICALSAVTTSLRALGKAREYSRHEQHEFSKSLSVFRLSVIIWYILSVIFAVPVLAEKWIEQRYTRLFLWALLFLILFFALRLIWKKVDLPAGRRGATSREILRYFFLFTCYSILSTSFRAARAWLLLH